MTSLFDRIASSGLTLDPGVLEDVLSLAVELAREGREGRKVGTIFMVGDSEAVLEQSRPLILDPLHGHPPEAKRLDDPDARETLKELSLLDGAFVISADGIALSAARYLYADAAKIDLPLGLGARHVAAAGMSARTQALAVVVSESSMIRIFRGGDLVAEIVPELWMLSRRALHLQRPYQEQRGEDMAVFTRS